MSPAQRVQQYSSPMSTKYSVLTARPITGVLATVRYGRTLKSLAPAQTEWFLFITECRESVASNRWPQVISSAQDLRPPMLFLLHRRIILPRLSTLLSTLLLSSLVSLPLFLLAIVYVRAHSVASTVSSSTVCRRRSPPAPSTNPTLFNL